MFIEAQLDSGGVHTHDAAESASQPPQSHVRPAQSNVLSRPLTAGRILETDDMYVMTASSCG